MKTPSIHSFPARALRAAGFFLFLFVLPAGASPATIYVPDDYPSIQAAVAAAAEGDTVVVRPGVYVENIVFPGTKIAVKSEAGPAATVIDGNRAGSVVLFTEKEDENTLLEGFTITNGTGATASGGYTAGGGICCKGSSPTIANNVITLNAADRGGGICCIYSDPVIRGNTIHANLAVPGWGGDSGRGENFVSGPVSFADRERRGGFTAGGSKGDFCGGGIYCQISDPVIKGNTISRNESSNDGGGICLNFDSSPAITGNVITGNRSGRNRSGAGIFLYVSSPAITNNLIIGNGDYGSEGKGAGILCWGNSSPVIANNVIMGNRADFGGGIFCVEQDGGMTTINGNTITSNFADRGGGICCYDSHPKIVNTIVWKNDAPMGPEIFAFPSASPTVTYCDVRGGWPGKGNIDAGPSFVRFSAGDVHIEAGSPCRDAGDNAAPGLPTFDFEGDPRFKDDRVDIGADEFHRHLYFWGDTAPGAKVGVRIVGSPMAWVVLARGRDILEPPRQTVYGFLYIEPPFVQQWSLGNVPATGVLKVSVRVPPGAISGDVFFFQALIGGVSGMGPRLTNAVSVVID